MKQGDTTAVRSGPKVTEMIDDIETKGHQVADMNEAIDMTEVTDTIGAIVMREVTDTAGTIDMRDDDHALALGLLAVMIENIEKKGDTSHTESVQLLRREMKRNLIRRRTLVQT